MWGFKFRWGSKLVCQDRLETGSKQDGYVVVSNALVSFWNRCNKNVILLKKTLHRKYPRRHYITERSNESCQIDLAYVKLPNMEKPEGFILMIGTIQILRNHYNVFFKK